MQKSYGILSKMGCSKCTKKFRYESALDRVIFGGFDTCPLRTEEEHRQQAYEAMEKRANLHRKKLYGVHFSSFMNLSVLDFISLTLCTTFFRDSDEEGMAK